MHTSVLKFILLYIYRNFTCWAFVSCMISGLCTVHIAAILVLTIAQKWFEIVRI